MKMFTDCSGECKDCYIHFVGGCIAGHGDDDFCLIDKDTALLIIKKGWVKGYLLDELKNKFSI